MTKKKAVKVSVSELDRRRMVELSERAEKLRGEWMAADLGEQCAEARGRYVSALESLQSLVLHMPRQ